MVNEPWGPYSRRRRRGNHRSASIAFIPQAASKGSCKRAGMYPSCLENVSLRRSCMRVSWDSLFGAITPSALCGCSRRWSGSRGRLRCRESHSRDDDAQYRPPSRSLKPISSKSHTYLHAAPRTLHLRRMAKWCCTPLRAFSPSTDVHKLWSQKRIWQLFGGALGYQSICSPTRIK